MAHSSVTEPPPDDDPTEESPNGQGEESDTVQSVARVNGMMAKTMVALTRYIVVGEYLFESRRGRVNKIKRRQSISSMIPVSVPV